MNNLIPRGFLTFPSEVFPSLLEDAEELLPATMWPTTNQLQGMSVSEDDKNVYVEAAVPGIDPKSVDVTFSNGVLTIKAEKKEEEKGKTYHRKATQSFFYRVTPGEVDSKIEPQAMCKNGMMTVTFAKMTEVAPKKIAVKTV